MNIQFQRPAVATANLIKQFDQSRDCSVSLLNK